MNKLLLHCFVASVLLSNLVQHSATLPSQPDPGRVRRSHGEGNFIIQSVQQVVRENHIVTATEVDHDEEEARQPPTDVNSEDVLARLSRLETKLEMLSDQNTILRQKLEEGANRDEKLNALVTKLEQILGRDVDAVDENIDERGKDCVETRLETLSEYLGNREAELVGYVPTRNTFHDTAAFNVGPKTLDLLARSLGKLSDRADSIESNVRLLQSQITRGGRPMEFRINASANTIDNRVPMPHRAFETGAGMPTPGINEANLNATRKVAFSVAATKPQMGSKAAQTVVFQDIMVNANGDYLESNHTFVCSTPGWYFFTFSLRTADGKYLGVLLMKNQDFLVSVFTDSSDRNTMETQSAVVELNAGDAVWLRLGPSETYGLFSDSYRYSTFNGFLLFKP